MYLCLRPTTNERFLSSCMQLYRLFACFMTPTSGVHQLHNRRASQAEIEKSMPFSHKNVIPNGRILMNQPVFHTNANVFHVLVYGFIRPEQCTFYVKPFDRRRRLGCIIWMSILERLLFRNDSIQDEVIVPMQLRVSVREYKVVRTTMFSSLFQSLKGTADPATFHGISG